MDTVARVFGLTAPTQYKSIHKMADVTNPDLLLGLELEIEELHDGLSYYTDIAGQAWSVVEDGSLRPRGRAWEFVSKPMPHGQAVQELRLLLGKLKLGPANYSDRTSVHVHTNVQDFTQEQLATLCLVYTCIEDVLFQFINFSEIDKEAHPEGMHRDTNIYCVPWTQCRMNQKLVEKLIYNPGGAVHNWQKYTALNLVPIQTQGTVEWRHLHGTNDMKKLGQWLNIIASIMHFAKNNSFDDVVRALKQLNDVSTYQQFFTSIVGDHLPYTDNYRASLADGCINAKYSLINWEVSKKAGAKMQPVEKKKKSVFGDFLDRPQAVETPEEAAERQRAVEQRIREIQERDRRRLQERMQAAAGAVNVAGAVPAAGWAWQNAAINPAAEVPLQPQQPQPAPGEFIQRPARTARPIPRPAPRGRF